MEFRKQQEQFAGDRHYQLLSTNEKKHFDVYSAERKKYQPRSEHQKVCLAIVVCERKRIANDVFSWNPCASSLMTSFRCVLFFCDLRLFLMSSDAILLRKCASVSQLNKPYTLWRGFVFANEGQKSRVVFVGPKHTTSISLRQLLRQGR